MDRAKEFFSTVSNTEYIKCHNTHERNEVIRFLIDAGCEPDDVVRKYAEEDSDDEMFMAPYYVDCDGWREVHAVCQIYEEFDRFVDFADIANIIYDGDIGELDAIELSLDDLF